VQPLLQYVLHVVSARARVCICSLSMQCACAWLSAVACLALHYFSTYSHKRHNFRKKLMELKWVFWFSLRRFILNISHFKTKWARCDKSRYRSSCTVPVIRVRFQGNLNILDKLWENTQISNFMKIRPVWAEMFHTDGQTWRSLSLFRIFANAPNNVRRLCGKLHVRKQ
jgi:hypothetical protein